MELLYSGRELTDSFCEEVAVREDAPLAPWAIVLPAEAVRSPEDDFETPEPPAGSVLLPVEDAAMLLPA